MITIISLVVLPFALREGPEKKEQFHRILRFYHYCHLSNAKIRRSARIDFLPPTNHTEKSLRAAAVDDRKLLIKFDEFSMFRLISEPSRRVWELSKLVSFPPPPAPTPPQLDQLLRE